MKKIKLQIQAIGWEKYHYNEILEIFGRILGHATLMFTRNKYVDVWEVQTKDTSRFSEIVGKMGIKKITVLEEKENSTIVMVYRSFFGFMKSLYYEYGCYVDFPIILEKNRLTLSIFGEEKSLKKFIEYLDSIKFRYKILQVTEYHFEVSSILNHLTEKQKEYLVKAYDNGYYEIPRRATSREIAKNVGISHQALIENLRKAEKKIMDYVIG